MVKPEPAPALTFSQTAIAAWGVLGVVLLLGNAIYRLTPVALEPVLNSQLSAGHIAIYAGWVVFSALVEGYRSFQKRFSPRVVARAVHLGRNPVPGFVLFAPLFCMGFFHSTRRGLISSWVVTGLVICAVLLVRALPQPWRGIVDGGVVIGLTWGVVSIVIIFIAALRGVAPAASPELPGESPSTAAESLGG